jgi:signal transduction histidine kinase
MAIYPQRLLHKTDMLRIDCRYFFVEASVESPNSAGHENLILILRFVARLASGIVTAFGTLVLLGGWALNIERLRVVFPGFPSMVPNTALCFILCGLALRLCGNDMGHSWTHRVRVVLGGVVAVVGFLSLIENVFLWDFHIDQLLFYDVAAVGYSPGRMSDIAAINFLLAGSALLIDDIRRIWIGQVFVVIVFVLALLNAVSFAYGVRAFSGLATYTVLALHTSVSFLVFSIGYLLVRPTQGVLVAVTSDSPGGIMARRLLPAAVVIPVLLGGAWLKGQQLGWYEPAFALSGFVLSNLVIFNFLIWWNAHLLHDLEGSRREVERALRESEERLRKVNEELEIRVADRTAALQRSNQELEQFAYVASHDLQEPLRMVASYTQLLAKRYQGKLDAKADTFIEHAVDGATRMQTLIKDLLSLSRVGSRGAEFAATDVSNAVQKALDNLQVAITESDARIDCGALPTLMGDGAQLIQLFQNLIGNAIKYRTDRPPVVRVTAFLQGSDWVFEIADNGIGFDPKQTNRIFMIFQRLHTRQQFSGTGIGLAVCKKIVERHGGRIWADSKPGEGSLFSFTIPNRLLVTDQNTNDVLTLSEV